VSHLGRRCRKLFDRTPSYDQSTVRLEKTRRTNNRRICLTLNRSIQKCSLTHSDNPPQYAANPLLHGCKNLRELAETQGRCQTRLERSQHFQPVRQPLRLASIGATLKRRNGLPFQHRGRCRYRYRDPLPIGIVPFRLDTIGIDPGRSTFRSSRALSRTEVL